MSRVLEIDLKNERVSFFEWEKLEIGAGLLGSLLMNSYYDLDGEAPFVISGGALSGNLAVGLAVAYICGLSAQSGGMVESKIEGRLASTLRGLNLAAVVLRGSTKSSVSLKIDENAQVEFIKTEKFKNHSVRQINEIFEDNFGRNYLVAAIGEPGDLRMANSSIVFDRSFPTSSGGLGADWGSRNLKYIAFKIKNVNVNPTALKITQDYEKRIPSNPLTQSELENPGMGVWPVSPALPGYLGAENFSIDISKGTRNFKPEKMNTFLLNETNKCEGCPQFCLKNIGNSINPGYSYLHQQALPIWFSLLGMSNVEYALEFNQSCHEIGFEHSSLGNMLAFLAETSNQIDFGDDDKAISLIRTWQKNPISFPGGTGKLLDATNNKNRNFAMHVKGIPIPPWDARGAKGLGLIMAINPSGPRYDVVEHDIDFDPTNWPNFTRESTLKSVSNLGVPMNGFFASSLDKNKVIAFLGLWQLWSSLDAIGICTYAGPPTRELSEQNILEMMNALLNKRFNYEDFIFLGKLRIEAQQVFNNKLKIPEKLNTLPSRFFDEPIRSGPAAGVKIDKQEFQEAKIFIYKALGWSKDAISLGTSVESQHVRELIEELKSLIANRKVESKK